MSTSSETVFRVQGIPAALTLITVCEALEHTFSGERVTIDTTRSTISPSCYSGRTQTALIHFSSHPPEALTVLKNGEAYDIRYGDTGNVTVMCVDKDFYGLTQLYANPGPIEADIITVPAMGSHAYGSWTTRIVAQTMWLRHFLSQDFATCRSMIFGYHAQLTADAIYGTGDFTQSFLEELRRARSSHEEKTRPVIFIGHSFGCIIIAQALVKAKQDENIHRAIFDSARGAIFFGAPHLGLVIADMTAVAQNSPPGTSRVKAITRGVAGLKTELKKFSDCAASIRLAIFFETASEKRLTKGTDGQWSRSGYRFTAVEKSTSMFPQLRNMALTLPAEGDLSSMVKFKNNAELSYSSAVCFLRSLQLGGMGVRNGGHDGNSPGADIKVHTPVLLASGHSEGISQNSAEDKTTLLHMAVNRGDKNLVRRLLETGKDASMVMTSPMANAALHLAVLSGDEEMVLLLLQNGAQLASAGSREGIMALHMAAGTGNHQMVVFLLKNGAEIDAATLGGFTALGIAAAGGDDRVTAILLKNGAVVAARRDGSTALHLAAYGGHYSLVQILLDSGVAVDAKKEGGLTALHIAACNGHHMMVDLLLKNGANCSVRTDIMWNALHLAARIGEANIVEMLLKTGADIETKDRSGLTALALAAQNGHATAVEALLRSGSNIEARDIHGHTALMLAADGGNTEAVQVLLHAGASIVAECISNNTALHWATVSGSVDVVEMLLKSGASITANPHGLTALHTAAIKGHDELVQVFLTFGVPIDGKSEWGATALHLAARGGHVKALEVLLDNSAAIEERDDSGQTPLMKAAEKGHVQAVRALLRRGAKVTAKCDLKRTALHHAIVVGQTQVVGLLLENGASCTGNEMEKVLERAMLSEHHQVVEMVKTHKSACAID